MITDSQSEFESEMLRRARSLIPLLNPSLSKGDLGIVTVIGGSQDYTGAPFFAAVAAARLGCDLVHVVCPPVAAPIIKSYSPDLMVHPILIHNGRSSDEDRNLIDIITRSDVVILGPGLGRDNPSTLPDSQSHFPIATTTIGIIEATIRAGINLVLDADALFVLSRFPATLSSNPEANSKIYLTPNTRELGHLLDAFEISRPDSSIPDSTSNAVRTLASQLKLSILAKGQIDHLATMSESTAVSNVGSLKRSGGQGDTLTGCLATAIAWSEKTAVRNASPADSSPLAAMWTAATVTRTAARLAFADRGRGIQASDLADKLNPALIAVFGNVDAPNL